ncbi:fibrobacter succinogenes major paralogous domain-containing protein [Flavobacteriales bacterium]|nr:fibrobacter succinogenes major paralogous domain-containing protein [Flavobacteriales bacterium]
MRDLLILLCLFLFPFALSAQDTNLCEGQQYDVDGDNVVGVGDVLSVLSWFGTVLDVDLDGTLDCNDDCVGVYDECGVCNGLGPQVQVLDTIIITYDSIYVEAINDWVTYELGTDSVFTLQCDEPDSFNACGDSIAMDGYSYSTVLIGDQCWFAENLRTTVYGNGDAIPAGLTDGEWSTTSSGATAVYGEDDGCNNYSPDIDACDEAQSLGEYGRLYNWYAVDDPRGLCPTGWHVPTDEEWTDLENHIGLQGFSGTEGTALKSTYGWSNGGNGTDDFGFSALPGGYRSDSNGVFANAGDFGNWWSSSPSGGNAWFRYLNYYNPGIYWNNYNPCFGFSVRCLRDAD